MRRLISIALFLALLMPLCALFPALAQTESQLPLCCRRAGAHHCMAMTSAPDSATPKLRIHCPALPRPAAARQTGAWSAETAPSMQTGLLTTPARVGQVEAGFRLSSIRTRQKRGPPSQTT